MAMPTACYHAGKSPCPKCRYDINRANWVGQTDAVLLSVMASHAYICDCAACKEYNAKKRSQKSPVFCEIDTVPSESLQGTLRYIEENMYPVAEIEPHVFLED